MLHLCTTALQRRENEELQDRLEAAQEEAAAAAAAEGAAAAAPDHHHHHHDSSGRAAGAAAAEAAASAAACEDGDVGDTHVGYSAADLRVELLAVSQSALDVVSRGGGGQAEVAEAVAEAEVEADMAAAMAVEAL